nr:MAG TPA: hypothetical protein [Crassvirales sp.]
MVESLVSTYLSIYRLLLLRCTIGMNIPLGCISKSNRS